MICIIVHNQWLITPCHFLYLINKTEQIGDNKFREKLSVRKILLAKIGTKWNRHGPRDFDV